MRLAEQLGANGTETLERFRRIVTSRTKSPLPKMALVATDGPFTESRVAVNRT